MTNLSTSYDLTIPREVTTLRNAVEDRLREAIAEGAFKPGQRLIERELCNLMGVGRTSIREALRQLEAEGLVSVIARRGPVVSTMSLDEARQLYEMRALLEGFAGRACAERKDPEIIAMLARELGNMRTAEANESRKDFLAAKTGFYAALLKGCENGFVERALNLLLNRVTLLRITSMTHRGRIRRSIEEIALIVSAIEAGNVEEAQSACETHVHNAALAALAILEKLDPENP